MDKPIRLMTIKYKGRSLDVMKGQYINTGRDAIMLQKKNGEPFAVLSVNMPDILLEEGEICIKTWSENAEIAAFMKTTSLFEDTGKRFETGFVIGQIWKLI